jgi:hypothetical protein
VKIPSPAIAGPSPEATAFLKPPRKRNLSWVPWVVWGLVIITITLASGISFIFKYKAADKEITVEFKK